MKIASSDVLPLDAVDLPARDPDDFPRCRNCKFFVVHTPTAPAGRCTARHFITGRMLPACDRYERKD